MMENLWGRGQPRPPPPSPQMKKVQYWLQSQFSSYSICYINCLISLQLITSVVGRDWRSIVETCVIENWKEALAALVTYGRSDEFFELCDLLGQRLENEGQDYSSAMVCYICSGNVERLVACWSMTVTDPSALSLQELIEKVMILKKAVEREKRQAPQTSNTCLAEQLR